MTPAAFAAIWFVHLLAAISPGPAVLMAARTGLTWGAASGVALAAGLGIGACIWAAGAMFGLKLLFDWAPGLLLTLRIAGAVYLLWMAVQLWRGANDPLPTEARAAQGGVLRLIRLGITTQLANPKPAIFFGAIFANMIPPDAGPGLWLALLAMIFANEILWNSLVARIFSLERMKRGYLGLKATIDRVFGGLLVLLGLKLATG